MKRRPLAVVSTYGSHRFGMGHLYRDMELCRGLIDDIDIAFQVGGGDQAPESLKKSGFDDVSVKSLRAVVTERSPDIIIYDCPYALGPMEELGAGRPRVVALDYFYYEDDRIDVAINIKNHYLGRDIRIPNVHEGTRYAIIRHEILTAKARMRMINPLVQKVLVTFGGADPRNNTQKVLKLLARITDIPLNIEVVLGSTFRKGLKYVQEGVHAYIIRNDLTEIWASMVSADIAFCGAGTTLMELLYLGCPTAVIPQTQAELKFAQTLAENGAIKLVAGNNDINEKPIEALIRNQQLREKMRTASMELFDGQGIARIKDIILRELEMILC